MANRYRTGSADTGFTPALSAIESHVKDRKAERKDTLSCVCSCWMKWPLESMWNIVLEKFHGYVDLGCGIFNDSLPEAKDALVFMVVAIDESWKIPVAYFLVHGLTGEERASLVTECLHRLHHAVFPC